MAIALDTDHVKRYRDIARLLIKYGRSDLLAHSGSDDIRSTGDDAASGKQRVEQGEGTQEQHDAQELAGDLERMGPLFIKLGQVLSSRADILPPAYLHALARLQDRLEPFPYQQVEQTVQDELGVRISKAFAWFDPQPAGSASLGQVHRAALRDGRPVAVKVQRPGIRTQIAEDLDSLAEVVRLADAHTEAGRRIHFTEFLDEFRSDLLRELDYRQEASNLIEIGRNLATFERILVPRPIPDYYTSRVLTMEYVEGRKVTELGPLARLDTDMDALADELFRAYLQQILVDGVFHADPHPGNVLVTPDGRIALIDLGMVGRLSEGMQSHLLKLLIAVSEGRSENVADLAIRMGDVDEDFDEAVFRQRVAELVSQQSRATVADMQIGRALMRFSQVTGESGIRMPSELTLFGKALLNLDDIGRRLDPDFDPNAAIRRHAGELARQRVLRNVTPGRMVAGGLEAEEILSEMPRRVNRILDTLARNEMRFRVEAIDEATLIEGFQKVANRIAMGIVLAALIIGAAMLMRVDTAFRLFGYPGLAILCFLAAAAGGVWLLVSTALHDRAARTDR